MDGFAAEGVVLKVEETSGTLNICHAFGRRVLQAGECFAAGKRPLELTDELVEMVLYHTIEIDELYVRRIIILRHYTKATPGCTALILIRPALKQSYREPDQGYGCSRHHKTRADLKRLARLK